jgi:hypothetical protein
MLVRNKAVVLLGVLGFLSSASLAAAQSSHLGHSGTFALSGERIFGVGRASATLEPDGGGEVTSSSTEVSFLLSGGRQSPFTAPRIGFDGFVTAGVSIGGFFGVVSHSSEVETEMPTFMGGTVRSIYDGPSETAIVFGSRGGYAYMFNDTVGIWPRLGFSYFTDTTELGDGDEITVNGLALSVDALLVVAPIPHFGFTLGPVLDLGLTGSTDTGMQDIDTTVTDFGGFVGLVGWL